MLSGLQILHSRVWCDTKIICQCYLLSLWWGIIMWKVTEDTLETGSPKLDWSYIWYVAPFSSDYCGCDLLFFRKKYMQNLCWQKFTLQVIPSFSLVRMLHLNCATSWNSYQNLCFTVYSIMWNDPGDCFFILFPWVLIIPCWKHLKILSVN